MSGRYSSRDVILMRKRLGTELEEHIEARLKEYDKSTRRTFNSGAVFGDGDIETEFFVIECKDRNTDCITINKDVWEQVDHQATKKQKDAIMCVLLRH